MSVENSTSSTSDVQEINDSIEKENTTTAENDTTTDNNITDSESNTAVQPKDEKEEALTPPPPPPLKMPENSVWEACWDENTKNYYYWNTETDEVTWDNPFEGNEDKVETKNNEKKSDDASPQDLASGDEDYEIEVEGYEEALKEQQQKQQEEEKETENDNNNNTTTTTTTTTLATTTTIDPSTSVYTNPTDPNYYYGYDATSGYDYSQYASYYDQYNYAAYPTDYSAPADKDTLSNFDSLLNKIDDAKEKFGDLSGPDKDKKEGGEKDNTDKESDTGVTASTTATNYYENYWNYPPQQYVYPPQETSSSTTTPGQFQEYSVSGYFNKRTGRFQQNTSDIMINTKDYFTPESKGERQMQYYFNPEAYQQHYNTIHQSRGGEGDNNKSGKRKLSRKEIEHFKKMKKQKRDDKLKRKYMD
ncbi:hypothetical protein BCR36DRAFT_405438 [Piromyces finnis]|uniref:WW domain-containing protein n=1 Tax=Piromyces finnis TaxID=1754191 RepID=A0A1Y1V588_9FUNG|nr:hypothetical protein BCR36DRAFT_405438 [Piromyces finnis]|eukprot:ORX47083.1 hypothetical protein BCR36DRAFT_405438 [Piromyces finnis]